MTVLVTGFDAFGEVSSNPSQLIVEALEELSMDGVATAVLPTSYSRGEARIRELLRVHRPTHTLMLGLSRSAKAITLEQLAINLDACDKPDNDGDLRPRQRIIEQAPAAYWNSLPLERMALVANEFGNEVDFSRDAGGYVCNHVFFTAAHFIASSAPDTRSGFVHIPFISEPGGTLVDVLNVVKTWVIGWRN